MEKRRISRRVKRTLSLQDFDASLKGTAEAKKPIYIYESLTKENKIIFSKCREFKKNHGVRLIWIKNGKIFLRKTENAQIYMIESINDLLDVN